MNERNKIITGWIAFIFVVFHLSALFLFAAPAQFGLLKGKKFVSPYVVPLFEQSWSMFAPCPVTTGKIKVKIQYADESTDWFYPGENAQKWHQYLRASHHGDLVILESNLIYWLTVDLDDFNLPYEGQCPSYLIEAFKHAHSFHLIGRYVYGWGLKNNNQPPISARVEVDLHNVKTGEKGTFKMPVYQW